MYNLSKTVLRIERLTPQLIVDQGCSSLAQFLPMGQMSMSNVLKIRLIAQNENYSFICKWRVFIFSTLISYSVKITTVVLIKPIWH